MCKYYFVNSTNISEMEKFIDACMRMDGIVQADVQALAFGISERMLLKREPIIQTNCSLAVRTEGVGVPSECREIQMV